MSATILVLVFIKHLTPFDLCILNFFKEKNVNFLAAFVDYLCSIRFPLYKKYVIYFLIF